MRPESDPVQSAFVRPDRRLLADLVERALAEVSPSGPDAPGVWAESGSRVLVYLVGEVAIRVSRHRGLTGDLLRAQALVDALPQLPFDVPRSLGDPVESDGHIAVPVRRLRGRAHPPGGGDPPRLRALLSSIHAIDPAPLRAHLATPRAFAGGEHWEAVLRDEVIALLSPGVRDRARARVDELARLYSPERVVNHGDLGGNNVLWDGDRVTGVLDWDLTAYEDPAEDVAALATWHGWHLLSELTDADTAARATVFRRSFPLQAIAFALVNGRPQDELDRAIARVETELRQSGCDRAARDQRG